MRLPLATPLKSRPNDAAVDARLKNSYVEVKGQDSVVRSRPGNIDLGSLGGAGLAQLLAEWNGLLAVSGDSLLGLSIDPPSSYTATIGAVTLDDYFWYHNGAIFAIDTALGNVMRSADGGATASVKSAIPDVIQACPVSFLSKIYYFGTTDTYSSSDDGASWDSEGATSLASAFYTVGGSTLYGFEYVGFDYMAGTLAYDVSTSSDAVTFAGVGTLTVQFSGDGVQEEYESTTNVCYVGGTLIAVVFLYYLDNSDVEWAENLIYTSADGGATWSQTYQENVIGGGTCFWGVRSASGGGKAYFAAEAFPYSISSAKVMSTSDGVSVSTELTYDASGNGVSGPASVIYGANPIAVWPTFTASHSYLVELSGTGEHLAVDSTTSVSPVTADLLMAAETTGAAQSNQQMLIKNSEQGWVYTR